METQDKHIWWQKGIVYQIYPRSFMDSTGNGIGDLIGIMDRLDYLKDLGIKAVWISPIYPSPMADFGYDVSDYTAIHPLFGDMEDFDRLLQEIHRLDMKLILDFVPNHTSDQHPWFLESKKSRDNPKRDWYIWKDPGPEGGPPNNWLSEFGGPGWEFHPETGQYYYHAYLKEQPDLNWRNEQVQKAMLGEMKFWLDKGVDGFRIDVMWHMIKDDEFRNNPVNPDYNGKGSPYDKLIPAYSTDQPEVHEIVRMMRDLTDQYHQRVIIGEIYLPIHKLITYYGQDNSGAHLPFNFSLIKLPWEARKIEAVVNEYEGSLPPEGWPNWVLGNHDQPRIASRVGKDQAKVAGMLLLTLKGTPTMYYGDELGMVNVPIPEDKVQDPREKNVPGRGLNRDPERTPMQWDSSENAGFTSGEPWLPVMENFMEINVSKENNDPGSMLHFYKRLIKTRSKHKTLQVGDYVPLETKGNLLAYLRDKDDEQFMIVLNLGDEPSDFSPHLETWSGEVAVATDLQWEGRAVQKSIPMEPNLGILIKLNHKK